MAQDPSLFDLDTPRIPAGRVRRGDDADIRRAKAADVDLPAGRIAALRTLADQIDQLERFCRSPKARPYDRIPLTGMLKEHDDIHRSLFAVLDVGSDPFTAAIAALLEADRAEADHTDRSEPSALD